MVCVTVHCCPPVHATKLYCCCTHACGVTENCMCHCNVLTAGIALHCFSSWSSSGASNLVPAELHALAALPMSPRVASHCSLTLRRHLARDQFLRLANAGCICHCHVHCQTFNHLQCNAQLDLLPCWCLRSPPRLSVSHGNSK